MGAGQNHRDKGRSYRGSSDFIRSNAVATIAVAIAVLVTAYGVASAEPGPPVGGVRTSSHGASALASAKRKAKLPKNSVGTAQLKKNAVNGSKVADNSLTGADIVASTLGTVPNAVNADTLDGKHAADFLGAGATAVNSERLGSMLPSSFLQSGASAGGALAGTYPNPTLDVSGGPCVNGQALTDVSSSAALTCGPGVYSDSNSNLAVSLEPFPAVTTGEHNTALGPEALQSNTTGKYNTAVGKWALVSNTTGSINTAVGRTALNDNSTGNENAALGNYALTSNTTGSFNAAVGAFALAGNTTGEHNSALGGRNALQQNTTGHDNSAFGTNALQQNTTGSNNSAIGAAAMQNNLTGNSNVALGWLAGVNLTTGDNNIDIANPGVAGESNAIRIGNQGTQNAAYLAGVSATNLGGQPAVVVNGEGRLGVETSSRRFKTDIQPIGGALDRLMALRPISFRYKNRAVHGANRIQYGLLAEQVAKVYPNLVARGGHGRPYSVLYQELPALLLAQVQRQQRQIAHQQSQIDWLMRRVRGR